MVSFLAIYYQEFERLFDRKSLSTKIDFFLT